MEKKPLMADLFVNTLHIDGVEASVEMVPPSSSSDTIFSRAMTENKTVCKLSVKPCNRTNLFIPPLLARPGNPEEYHQLSLQQHIDFLLKRIAFSHPGTSCSSILDQEEYEEDPSFKNMKKIKLQLNYKGGTALCGPVYKLIWMDSDELAEVINEQIKVIIDSIKETDRLKAEKDAEEQAILAKKAREADPLYPWAQRMTHFGYYGQWKVQQATCQAPAGVRSGDIMVSITFSKLRREDKDVFIGVLHELVHLSDNDLRRAIDNAYQKASGTYESCHPGLNTNGSSLFTNGYTSFSYTGSLKLP